MAGMNLFLRGRMLAKALSEQKKCIRNVYAITDEVLQCPADVPPQYRIQLAPISSDTFRLRKNLFSVLFMSTYHALDIPVKRRLIYGQILHLFRIWVTSADNLLDREHKTPLPLQMPSPHGVMSQVVSIMTANRVLHKILSNAVNAGELTLDQADKISYATLQTLLPSAAQEASEEGGITQRPSPQEIRNVIHLYKTALLFQLPFIPPLAAGESCSMDQLKEIKTGLMQFGCGCQLLDDVRDMATDLVERRHNYLLSWLAAHEVESYQRIIKDAQAGKIISGERLYHRFPDLTEMVISEASRDIRQGLLRAHDAKVGLSPKIPELAPRLMLNILDLGDCNVTAQNPYRQPNNRTHTGPCRRAL